MTPEMQPVLTQFEKRERDKQRGYLKYDAHPLSTREVEILGLIMNGLTNPKKKMIITPTDEGATNHCVMENRSLVGQVLFDWLDEVFQP